MFMLAGAAQSVQQLATDSTFRRSNPGGGEVFVPDHTALGASQLSVKRVPALFLGSKRSRDVALTTHLHLTPRLKKE